MGSKIWLLLLSFSLPDCKHEAELGDIEVSESPAKPGGLVPGLFVLDVKSSSSSSSQPAHPVGRVKSPMVIMPEDQTSDIALPAGSWQAVESSGKAPCQKIRRRLARRQS